MRTHLEFASTEFPAEPGEEKEVNPGIFGKRLAHFLAEQLPTHGFKVACVGAEDWGWMVELENQGFHLWIGCANYEEFDHGFLCFIEPSKPVIKKLFSKIDAQPTVERLATALETILGESGKVSRLRWWTEEEKPNR